MVVIGGSMRRVNSMVFCFLIACFGCREGQERHRCYEYSGIEELEDLNRRDAEFNKELTRLTSGSVHCVVFNETRLSLRSALVIDGRCVASAYLPRSDGIDAFAFSVFAPLDQGQHSVYVKLRDHPVQKEFVFSVSPRDKEPVLMVRIAPRAAGSTDIVPRYTYGTDSPPFM